MRNPGLATFVLCSSFGLLALVDCSSRADVTITVLGLIISVICVRIVDGFVKLGLPVAIMISLKIINAA
jgi:hypothetical protein